MRDFQNILKFCILQMIKENSQLPELKLAF